MKAAAKKPKPRIERMKIRHMRFPDDLWNKCLALGGSEWVRDQVFAAPWPKKGGAR